MAITATLADFAAGLKLENVPQEVQRRAKALATDLIGSVVRAEDAVESAAVLDRTLTDLGLDGAGDAPVIGADRRVAPPVAALVNGFLGHSLDFDDTHADSSLHPSAPVVPAAFAAASMNGASGADVLAGIIAGYEVCCRLGNALDPTEHYARGFHPTATAGTFGAAAAAGRVLGLSAEQMISAFGVSGSQAAGSLQFLVNGGWNKPWQVGAAAMNGLTAATLARNGFIGAGEAIEGKHGLLGGYSGAAKPDRATAGVGTEWLTTEVAVKPYPGCRYSHAALDAILELRAEHALKPDDVRSMRIGLHRNGITLVGDPIEAKRVPRSIVAGQFSMPFPAAVALRDGAFGWDDYAKLGNPQIEEIASRIDVVRDERLEGRKHPFGAIVTIETDSGTLEREIADPSGEPSRFPDEAAQWAKFESLAGPVIGPDRARRLFDGLGELETIAAVEPLLSCRPAETKQHAMAGGA